MYQLINMDIHKDFLGVFETGSTTAEVLTTIIKDALCRCGLDCWGDKPMMVRPT